MTTGFVYYLISDTTFTQVEKHFPARIRKKMVLPLTTVDFLQLKKGCRHAHTQFMHYSFLFLFFNGIANPTVGQIILIDTKGMSHKEGIKFLPDTQTSHRLSQ